jgi:ribonuclease P protein component
MQIEEGWDMVIIARNGAKDLGYEDLKQSFFHLAKLHKIVKEV